MGDATLHSAEALEVYRRLSAIGRAINASAAGDVARLFRTLSDGFFATLQSNSAFLLAILRSPPDIDLYLRDPDGVIRFRQTRLSAAGLDAIFRGKTVVTKGTWTLFETESSTPVGSAIFVPLTRSDLPLGFLSMQHEQQEAFSQDSIHGLQILANHVAMAIHDMNSSLERRDRESALQTMSRRTIERSDSPVAVLKSVVENALILTRATRSDLDLYSEGRIVTTLFCDRADEGSPTVVSTIEQHALPRGIAAHVSEIHKPYYTRGDAQLDPYYCGSAQIHSELAVPLMNSSGRLIGVLNVESIEHSAFSDNDVRLLQLFADDAVIAFEIARSREDAAQQLARAQREIARFDSLVRIGEQLAHLGADGRMEACRIVTEEAAAQLDCHVVLRMFDTEHDELVLIDTAGTVQPPFERIKAGQGLTAMAFAQRRAVRIDDLHNPAANMPRVMPSDPMTRSLLVAPIRLGDSDYGSLSGSHSEAHHFGDLDEKLLGGLARLLSVTLNRIQSMEQYAQLLERNKRNEIISAIGDAGLDLAHRLGGDLGLVHSQLKMARRALDRGDRARADTHFNSIDDSVRRVLSLGKSLQNSVSTVVNVEPVAIALDDILSDLEVLRHPPPGCEVVISVEPNLPRAFAVAEHVRSIVHNLAENSFQAMKEGGRLTITATHTGSRIAIEFRDTGPGIVEAAREHIFKFLYSTKGSSGFGLWSAFQRATFNGGSLELVPSDQGAVFRLTLPSPPTGGAEVRKHGRVLVVDDNHEWRELLADVLQTAGIDMDSAADLTTARRCLGDKFYDLVLLDISLDSHGMDRRGLDLLMEIRRDARFENLAVILITGYATTATIRQAFSEGLVVDVLEKQSFDAERLVETIETIRQRSIAGERETGRPGTS